MFVSDLNHALAGGGPRCFLSFFVLFCPAIFVPFGKIGYERDKKDKKGQKRTKIRKYLIDTLQV